MDGLVWKEYETDEGHKYYYNKLDASTTWERPPDPDSADLSAPPKSSAAAADVSPLMMPAHEMAGTFAVKKTARGAASGALLEQGASLAPPSSNDTFSDFHKFVAQYADSDLGKELKQAEKDDGGAEPKKRGRHRRHLEARARMLSDIRNVDHRGRLRKTRDRADTRDKSSGGGNTSSRASSSSARPPANTNSRASNRASSDFARRADAVAGAIGGGSRGGGGGGGGGGMALDALKTQLERAQADADEYKAEARALRAENEQLRADNVKLSAKLSEAKLGRSGGGGSKTTDEKVEKYKSKVAKLEEDVKKYKAERDRAKKERDDYKARARNAENDLARRSTTPSSGGGGSVAAPAAPTADYDDHYTPGPSFEQYDDDGDQKWED